MRVGTKHGKRKWSEMNAAQKSVTIVLAVIQLTMAATAWRDLARRDATQVKGPKWRWALVIGANFFGPIAYFRRGRLASTTP